MLRQIGSACRNNSRLITGEGWLMEMFEIHGKSCRRYRRFGAVDCENPCTFAVSCSVRISRRNKTHYKVLKLADFR